MQIRYRAIVKETNPLPLLFTEVMLNEHVTPHPLAVVLTVGSFHAAVAEE